MILLLLFLSRRFVFFSLLCFSCMHFVDGVDSGGELYPYRIGEEGVLHLSKALKENSTLLFLNIFGERAFSFFSSIKM